MGNLGGLIIRIGFRGYILTVVIISNPNSHIRPL